MPAPNIVFITCHDLGRYLGCYGAPVESPNLDRLAGQGICFEKAFATSPLCSPSRASLHTGLYPHEVGVNGLSHEPFGMEITRPDRHLAHLLGDAGYAERILVGFQHLTGEPDALGYTDSRFKLDSAEAISREACEVLAAMDGSQPFYLEVGFFETHRPFDWGGVQEGDPPDRNPFPFLPDSPEAREEAARLGGAVKALDDGVGRILDALEKAGLAANTWVVFATDHGLPFPRAKGTLYDAGLETSLLMRWPQGHLTSGIRATGLVSLVDIVPTLADALSLGDPGQFSGTSLWPWIRGGAGGDGPREHLFAEKTFHTGYEPMRSVRTRHHKLILNFETGPAFDIATDIIDTPTTPTILDQLVPLRPACELYDLADNPSETDNRDGHSALQAEQDRLNGLLGSWMRATGDPLLDGPVPSPRIRSILDQLES